MGYISWPEPLISPAVAQTLRLMQLVQRRGGVRRDRRTGTYLVASHDAVIECVTSPHVVRAPGALDAVADAGERASALITHLTSALDGEQHACARRATRSGIADAELAVRDLVEQEWSAARSNVDFDLVADFALPISRSVANATSGLTARSGTGLSDVMSEAFTGSPFDSSSLDQLATLLRDDAVEALSDRPSGTAADHLATAWHSGDIDEPTAVGATAFASLAAIETLSSSLATLAAAIHVSGELAELARAEPSQLVSEALRLTATVQMFHFDTTCDLEIGGVVIPGGSRLLIHYGAACRDPNRFERPDEVAATPRPADVAFGRGSHSCLGAALARQISRAAVDVMVAQPLGSTPLRAQTTWTPSVFIHTPTSCRLY